MLKMFGGDCSFPRRHRAERVSVWLYKVKGHFDKFTYCHDPASQFRVGAFCLIISAPFDYYTFHTLECGECADKLSTRLFIFLFYLDLLECVCDESVEAPRNWIHPVCCCGIIQADSKFSNPNDFNPVKICWVNMLQLLCRPGLVKKKWLELRADGETVRPVRVERSQLGVKKRVSGKRLHGGNDLFVWTLAVFNNSIVIATAVTKHAMKFHHYHNDLD